MSLATFPGLACYFLAILGVSAAVTLLLLRRFRIIDLPNERSSHSTPTPRGGGLGIVLGFFFALVLIHLHLSGEKFGDDALTLSAKPFAGFLLAALLIAGISLYDDVAGRGYVSKLLIQLIAALLVMGSSIDARQMPLLPEWLAWASWPLILLWLIGLTNAYNFMDGLDGIAGATAIVVAAFFALICWQQGLPLLALATLAICAGSCGFLLFNWPPARIFMGDVGSTFLGFAFAAFALLAAGNAAATTAPQLLLVMPLLLLHYIFDTAFTFCRRLLAGENLAQAHRGHLYQLLNRSGFSHRSVSLLYAGLAVAQGLAALWLSNAADATNHYARLWIFAPFLLGYTLFAFFITHRARRSGII